jgi:hypothetical protein
LYWNGVMRVTHGANYLRVEQEFFSVSKENC